ncbi:hypothetical protein [Parvibaculum sp.]|jgi:hypothetical protein|uniref:hypothetical protein n=1 Tax=Parvibaculum sp. TaxID=2024848 RepID=UPI000C95D838|nr:hypothetical protein [Parvibaculum sp.]MAB13698.1 hypothetical protein [Parvibaculum sp.]|tara:strand:- start:291 stop:482 length:192 start_codon:yes stop_codon:yes gene_type:complete
MTKLVFTAIFLAACYSAYRAVVKAAERQRMAMAEARSRSRMEPRDMGRLRRTRDGYYVPEDHR